MGDIDPRVPPGVVKAMPEDRIGVKNEEPRELANDRRLWYKQPGESSQAYESFMIYLTIPRSERSVAAAGRLVGKSKMMLDKWSRMWRWDIRSSAFEEHYLLIDLEAIQAEQKSMFDRQKQIIHQANTIITGRLARLLELANTEDGKEAFDEIPLQAIARLMDVAGRSERMMMDKMVELYGRDEAFKTKLREEHAEEMAGIFSDVFDELKLSPEQQEKVPDVLRKHLVTR